MARMRRTKRSDRQKASKKNVDRFAKNRAAKAKERKSRVSTGGESTGREKGIMASQKVNKIKSLEQSVGSLDRRINKAIESGDLDQAKDLRSRQNKFTTKLGHERAIESGGVLRDSSGRIVRSTRTGQPIMNTQGRTIFDQTKDMDFIDPTRRIQNVGGKAYSTMYPMSSKLQEGPLWYQGLKGLFDKGEKRKIPYTDERMPGERYPLDKGFGAYEDEEVITEEEPFYGGRSPLDEESSLDDIIKRYTPPETIKPKIKPKPEPDWPRRDWKDAEIVDQFGLNTIDPKEVIVNDVLKNLTQNIMTEENVSQDEAENIARNSLAESTLTKPSWDLGEFTEKFRTGNAEKEAKTILQSLPPEVIQAIPPEVITSSSAIDIINSLPPEIIEKTKVEVQEKAIPNIYQAPGEKVLTMEDLAAEAGTGPTLSEAFPLKKMGTTVADMIPYLATGYSGNEWADMATKALDTYGNVKNKIFGGGAGFGGDPVNQGFNTQDGGEWWEEQEQIKSNTADLLKNQYNLNDDQIEELLNIKTGFNF